MRTTGQCCEVAELDNYSESDSALCTASDDPIRGIQCSKSVPLDVADFTLAQRALFNSYSLGMVFDRSQACPTIDDQDSLNSYFDISGEKVYLEMDSVKSSTDEKV